VRYDAMFRELAALDADIIGLNEVTCNCLERLLHEDWVRQQYTVSVVPDNACCAHVSTLIAGSFGNLLLSKYIPSSLAWVDQPGDGRHSHVMSLRLCDPHEGGEPKRIAVCSTHLTACPWLMEGRRKRQLAHLTSTLTTKLDSDRLDACVIMGDFNFHREAENASIPERWSEVPAVVDLGATWDFGKNRMLAHYLPLHNIYNGLGLGTQFGWPSPMRLDRVLVFGSTFDCAAAAARLFADQPIDERACGQPPLPQTGRVLQESHRSLPWQDFLHPSDHFGIFLELLWRHDR